MSLRRLSLLLSRARPSALPLARRLALDAHRLSGVRPSGGVAELTVFRFRSTYSSILCPIESIDSQLADAEAEGWRVAATVWSDSEDAWKVLLKRKS